MIANAKASFGDDVAKWQPWATEHGWTYEAEAPELVGRYRTPYDEGAERYCNFVTTTLNGLPVSAFERWVHSYDPGSRRSSGSEQAFVVVHLPGLPPEQFRTAGPERAIRELGGAVPSGSDLELQGQHLLAYHPGRLKPAKLLGDAQLLTVEISAMPESFWS